MKAKINRKKKKEINPEFASNEMNWSLLKEIGNKSFSEQNYAFAIESYTKAIQMMQNSEQQQDPVSLARLFSNRSAAYLALGGSQGSQKNKHNQEQRANALFACKDAEQCISLDPCWAKGYFRLGSALQLLDQIENAADAFQRGLKEEPENSDLNSAMKEIILELETLSLIKQQDLAPEFERYNSLVSWLVDGGATFPDIFIKCDSENNRGVHARRTIQQEEKVMSIPRCFLITVEMGKQCEVGQKVLNSQGDLIGIKHSFLSIFVLTDRKNPDSFFQPYYRTLPESYANMPIFWEEEELSWLQGSYMLVQIEEKKEELKADYDEICRCAPEFKEISLQEFSWARMMVASRNFGIKIGEKQTDALVPYADMLNHFRPRETKWTFSNEDDAFIITSLTDFPAGKQVNDSYGKKCNSRFLLNYGFTVENNCEPDGTCPNEVHLYLELPHTVSHFDTKRVLLDDDESGFNVRVSTNHDDKNTREAFSYARSIYLQSDELSMMPPWNENTDLAVSPIGPISCENEVAVLHCLADLCSSQLNNYPATIEEDVERLSSSSLEMFSNKRNALILVMGEKEVCKFYVQLAQVAIPILEKLSWKDCKKLVHKEFQGNDGTSKYIRAVVVPLVKNKS